MLKLVRKSLNVLDYRLNMSLTTKVKVAKFSFLNEKSYNKTVIDFNSVNISFYLPLKVIFTSAQRPREFHFFG